MKKLIANFTKNIKQKDDFWDKISNFEKSELLTAIEESEKEENLISHEEFKKTYSKWLER